MNTCLKKKLIYLIKIYNAAAKLTLYDTKPEIVNTLDTAYDDLLPYRKYWEDINPKIGVLVLNKH